MLASVKRCLRTISIALLAPLFIALGINHFVSPDVYMKIMPDFLPWPLPLVLMSGFFEVLGGVGLALPKLRRAAGWGLIALFSCGVSGERQYGAKRS